MFLRWSFKRKSAERPEPNTAGPASGVRDELAFLRGRPDFDAEEMASVRSSSGVSAPTPRAGTPVGTGSGSQENR
jgi:hypothetical protein